MENIFIITCLVVLGIMLGYIIYKLNEIGESVDIIEYEISGGDRLGSNISKTNSPVTAQSDEDEV